MYSKKQFDESVNIYTKAIRLLPTSLHVPTTAWYLQQQPGELNLQTLFRYPTTGMKE
jgi:hypothetical protein